MTIPADFIATCIGLARVDHLGDTSISAEIFSYPDDGTASAFPSFSPPQYAVSSLEARLYYAGLPSNPGLIYRTGKPWRAPTGFEAYRKLKVLRPVFGHKLNTVWNDLGPKVCDFLDSAKVLWTSIDVVRVAKVEEDSDSDDEEEAKAVDPVVLCIGVFPETLCGKAAHNATHGCLNLLREFGIMDVEVELRDMFDPTVDVRGPLTPALGLAIAALATPHVEGTGGFYLAEGGDSEKVLLVTARHVLFPQNEGPNVDYTHTNTHPSATRKVLLLGTKAFDNFDKSVKVHIGHHSQKAQQHTEYIETLQDKMKNSKERKTIRDQGDVEEASRLQELLDKSNNAIEALYTFHKEVAHVWAYLLARRLGHIVRSPPITMGAGPEGFMEDYAVVELDNSKFEKAFNGNVIDLGTKISLPDFTRRMNPRFPVSMTFKYPLDRLLKLRDIIPEDHIHNPTMTDPEEEPSLLVIKSGNASGVTIGRATGIFSFVRQYFNNGTHQTSKEWAILPYNHKPGGFSAPGDSGAVIVDGRGRFGGLLTGHAGKRRFSDISYATPLFWLLPRINASRPLGFLTLTSTRSWTRRRGG